MKNRQSRFDRVLIHCFPLFSVAMLLTLAWSPYGAAQGLLPIVESLEMKQQTQYLRNAPDGLDSAPAEPMLEDLVPLVHEDPHQPSIIEEQAQRSQEKVNLDHDTQQQVVKKELEQFGYDLFRAAPTTFSLSGNVPIPGYYQTGPGDTLLIQLYGKKNVEYRLVVQRDGRLLIPEVGPVNALGLSFDEVKFRIQKEFEKRYIGAQAIVTLTDVRAIQVLVTGEASFPGRYSVSGLSTLLNALLSSGGIKRSGTLRDIHLKRDGKTVVRFDLYSFLLEGDTRRDVRLQQGDVIFIPPIGATVGIAGEVQRPAIYELAGEDNVAGMIELAGGLQPTASLVSSHIERIGEHGYRTLVDFHEDRNTPFDKPRALTRPVRSGDILRILPVLDTVHDIVQLSGNVYRPGAFQFVDGMSIGDLVGGVSALLPNTDMDFALLRREIPDTTRTMVRFVHLAKALTDRTGGNAFELRPRDELIVFERAAPREQILSNLVRQLDDQTRPGQLASTVELIGHVRHPGRYPLQLNATLERVLDMSGGLLPGVDQRYILFSRRAPVSAKLNLFSLQYKTEHGKAGILGNPVVQPGDRIYVFGPDQNRVEMISAELDRLTDQSDNHEPARVVYVDGPVNFPGRYPLELGMHVDDLIRAAGGLRQEAYNLEAELTRFILDGTEIRKLHHETISLDTGRSSEVHELSAYDRLRVMLKPGFKRNITVQVKGAVQFPGSFVMKEGEHLCNLVERFGDITDRGYLFGAVFMRESVRKKEQRAFDRIRQELDDLLVRLHLSPSANNEEKMPAGENKHQILRAIQQLKSTPAIGRIVVDIEAARDCDHPASFVLEDGDRLFIPERAKEVSVVGQVYFPTSHRHVEGNGSRDYINLSGGHTVLGRLNHAYVVQGNGEVLSMRRKLLKSAKNIPVTPGATIYVPIDVDRMNGHEKARSWTKSLFHLAVAAASLNVVGIF